MKQLNTVQTFGIKRPRFDDNSYTEEVHLAGQRAPGSYAQDRLPIKRKIHNQNNFGK